MAQTKKFDILSFSVPAKFKLLEEKKRIVYQIKEANTFCQVHLWPAQQGSSDPEANFKTDWDYFAGNQYKIGEPKEKQTEKQNGWDIVTGVGVAAMEELQFIISVSTFTQGDISWCAITLFNDEKYTADIDKFLRSIKTDTKIFVRKNKPAVPGNPVIPASQPVANGFQFTSTIDEGWISVPKEDWVEVTKGNIKALIHYPNKKTDEYIPDGDLALKTAWNVLVAPRYSNAAKMFFKSGDVYATLPDYGYAEMTDNATGKRVYVVLFKTQYSQGNKGKYVEIIAPSQTAFEQVFGNYENNKANKSLGELDKLQWRNKFAVAPGDLKGTWTSDFGAAVSYVYVATGLYAGMDTHSSGENFQFTGGGKYQWSLSVASGQVGNMRFQGAKSTGTVTVPDDWHVRFSDIEGKPKTFEAYFSCIKGLRILWLDGKAYAKKD